jgi:trans-L-3-hydroxyproline dehydratase
MRSKHTVNVVSCHAEGEVGDVIVGGVRPPPGDTLWAQSRWLAQDGALRGLLLHEPRGGVHRHINLLVPPKDPRAAMGFLIMEPAYNPPMSGSNSICVSTVLLETGLVEMTEPTTTFALEAPGGLVHVEAECADGRAKRIRVRNVASFAATLDSRLEVSGHHSLTVDTAYGGDSFVIVDADALGLALEAHEARDIVALGRKFTAAANAQLRFEHPQHPDWQHISFCLFASSVKEHGGVMQTRHACVIEPGKVDRSPTGTAVSARMACLHARSRMQVGDRLRAYSIIDSVFEGRIHSETTCGERSAIYPEIAGRAWLTGSHQYWLDPDDPYPRGYRISDTWPTPSSEDCA